MKTMLTPEEKEVLQRDISLFRAIMITLGILALIAVMIVAIIKHTLL